MSDSNKEFFALLDSVVKEQTLNIINSDGNEYKYRILSTNQLKAIIQTIIDTSTTQTAFHSTVFEIMKQNLLNTDRSVDTFNILDKLFFIIDNRINAVSPTLFIRGDEANSFIPTDLTEVKTKLAELIKNKETIEDRVVGDEKIKVKVGIPLIKTEQTVNKDIYSKLNLTAQDPSAAQETLGTTFLIEISKWMKELTIGDQTLNLETISYESKLEAVEKVPASVIEKVIDYIETTKQKIDDCLVVSNRLLPLNGTLFSVR